MVPVLRNEPRKTPTPARERRDKPESPSRPQEAAPHQPRARTRRNEISRSGGLTPSLRLNVCYIFFIEAALPTIIYIFRDYIIQMTQSINSPLPLKKSYIFLKEPAGVARGLRWAGKIPHDSQGGAKGLRKFANPVRHFYGPGSGLRSPGVFWFSTPPPRFCSPRFAISCHTAYCPASDQRGAHQRPAPPA